MAVDGTPDVLDRHCVVDYRDKVVVEGFCLIAYGVEICLFIFFFFFPNTDFHWDWFGLHCIQPAVSKDNIVSGSFRRGIAVVLVIRFGRVVRIKSRIASPFLGLSLI